VSRPQPIAQPAARGAASTRTRDQVHVGASLHAYLELLGGPGRRGLLEIRYRHQQRMGRLFVPTGRLDAAGRAIATLGARTDVYCGVVLRTRHAGGRDAVGRSHLVWVEIDHDDALERLDTFTRPASMIVRSGSGGHAHAYWQLRHPISQSALEDANRRLAHHLDADPASTDAARILRPCGTLNHKHTPPTQVTLAAYRPERRYELAELAGELKDPPGKIAARVSDDQSRCPTEHPLDERLLSIPTQDYVRALTGSEPTKDGKLACPFHALSAGRDVTADVSPACSPADASLTGRRAPLASTSGAASDPLRLVPPPVYFEQLTGLRVGRSGKLHCLFHDDRSPSLHVYREPDRGWYCFGCGRGGSIYDLAALLSGRETRGTEFLELKRDLERLFTSPVTTAAVRRAPWMVADRDQNRSRT
jgi:hypothetical protein